MSDPRRFFSAEDLDKIKHAIKSAELKTTGEIRVHIESQCPDENVLNRAADVFIELELMKTKERNGVLFYLSVDDHKFAILGDAGINMRVGKNFWEAEKNRMSEFFKKGEFANGLIAGINDAGEKLKEFFPWDREDINELTDEISFGI